MDSYGAYDCVPNAMMDVIRRTGFPEFPFLTFNWDMSYDSGRARLSGSAYDIELYPILSGVYGMKVEIIPPSRLSSYNGTFLAIVSMYDLGYSKFYRSREQDHCIVGRMHAPDTVAVHDPYFLADIQMPLEAFLESRDKCGNPIYGVMPNGPYRELPLVPYILSTDYSQKYEKALAFSDHLRAVSGSESPEKRLLFDKYFGMLNSVYLARARHFSASASDRRNLILGAWVKVQKRFVAGLDVADDFKLALQYEQDYLDHYRA